MNSANGSIEKGLPMRAIDFVKDAERAYAIWRGGQPYGTAQHWDNLSQRDRDAFTSVYFTARLEGPAVDLDLLKRTESAFDDWADAGYMNEPKRKLWNDITAAIAKANG